MKTLEYRGVTFVMTIEPDYDAGTPWDREDGHGPVSDWRREDRKKPGQLVLTEDGNMARFYDYAEACRIARRDQWGVPNPEGKTKRQIAAEAAMADFERLRAWCNDEWSYVGVCVHVQGFPDLQASLWGIESDSPEYHDEVARELAPEALSNAPKLATQLRAEAEKLEAL